MDSATSYNVEVNKSPDFASTGVLGSASTVNVHWVPPFQLPQRQPVYWRVRGNTPAGATDWGVGTYERATQAAPTLSAPADGAPLQQPNQPVRFAWSPIEGAVNYSLEISQDEQFVDPARITTYTTSSTSITPNVLQPANTYYWRVTANLGGGVNTDASAVRSYIVTNPDLPLEPIYPADGTTTTIQEVVLDWKPVEGAAKYNLQISTDPNFISGTTTVNNILGTRYSPPNTLDNDQYYWRITPVNASGVATDWPGVPTWHFRRNWPDQPSLEYPKDNAAVGDSLYFQWTGARLASDYTLQLSTDPTFPSSGTTSCPTVHTTFTPNSSACYPAAGKKYYWRVLATDAPTGVASEFLNAQVRSFTYLPDLVTLETPADGDSLTIPTLRWKPYSSAKQYRVSISNSSDKVVASATTTSTSYTPVAKLAAGVYHWQVQAITGDGRTTNAVLDSSQPRFTLSDPTAGVDATPEPDLAPTPTPRNPTLTWASVANATSYKIVYRAVGDTAWTTPTTSYAYPAGEIAGNGLIKGDYEWYVVAYAGSTTLSQSSAPGVFTIASPAVVENYRAAIVGTDLAAQGTSCDATLPATCKDLRQTPVLSWDAVPNAGSYRLVISRDDQLTNPVLDLSVYNTMWMDTAALPDSTAGSAYYWEVVPCTLAGCGALRQAEHAFNKLSNPVVLDQVTTAANDVTLSWQDYLGSLSAAPTDQTALSTPARTEAESYRVQTSTSPQFTTLLDNILVDQTTFTSYGTTYPEGPIYWRVQALDGSRNALAWSELGTFTKYSPGPKQVSPVASDVDGSPTFSWDPQLYAATYNLEVYKNNDDVPSPANRVVSATGLKQVNYTPSTPLPAATLDYRWRIQRVDGAGRVGAWSALAPFHVSGEPASPVAPASGATVEPRGTVFTWDPPVTGLPAKYRFTAKSGTSVVTADTVARAYAPVVKLADGQWTWTVSTLDTAGQVVATSAPRSFTVVGKPTTNVTITGSGKVGTALGAAPVVWTPSSNVTTTYQWYAGSTAIAGATSPQYVVKAVDSGKAISLRVTGSKPGYDTGTATSNVILVTTGASPIVTASPYISGTRAVGQTLTVVPGKWTGGTTTFTYRWFQSGVVIPGATARTYVVRTSDAARTLSSEVTAHQSGLAPGVARTPGVTVSRMTTRIGLSLAATRIHKRTAPRVTVTVSNPQGVTVTGLLRVYNGTRLVRKYSLTSANRGRVSLTLPRTTVGRHTIKARYLGNSVLSPSSYARATLTVIR